MCLLIIITFVATSYLVSPIKLKDYLSPELLCCDHAIPDRVASPRSNHPSRGTFLLLMTCTQVT